MRSMRGSRKSQAARVTVIHAMPAPFGAIEIVERALLPFDFARFKVASRSIPPITSLPPQQLLTELAEEYVFAELCEELMLSFAAENEARMAAMIAARSNLARKLDELVAASGACARKKSLMRSSSCPPAA